MERPAFQEQIAKVLTADTPSVTFLQTVWAYVHGKPIDVKQVIELTRVDEHGNRTTQSSKSSAPVIRAEKLRPYQRCLVLARKRFNCWVCHRRFGKSAVSLLLTLSGPHA